MLRGLKKIALVGNPNVGKSALFNRLTGAYVNVSNYPGTTVEISRGRTEIGGETFEVLDTPGMYSLLPVTEEEKVARNILLRKNPEVAGIAFPGDFRDRQALIKKFITSIVFP